MTTRPVVRLAAIALAVAFGASACDRAASSPSVPSAPVASPSAAPSAASATPTPSPIPAASPSPTASLGAYDWSYDPGPTGPDHWADLDPSYYACRYGVTQSPIELAGADEMRERDPVFDYHPDTAHVVNMWNTVMAIPTDLERNSVEVHGLAYGLRQLQFHVPPEHVIYGAEPAAAEVQFVHQHRNGQFLIVGAMVVEGADENEAWAPYIDAMVEPITFEGVLATIDWPSLIPIEPEMDSYRYDGSLTSPPCTERIEWIFLLKPIELSAAQIDKMRAAYDGNARPLQPLGHYRDVTRDLKDD